jgi:hypothetical protein
MKPRKIRNLMKSALTACRDFFSSLIKFLLFNKGFDEAEERFYRSAVRIYRIVVKRIRLTL